MPVVALGVGNTWDIPWCQMTSMLPSSSKRLGPMVLGAGTGGRLVATVVATGWGPSVMFVCWFISPSKYR